MIDEKRHRIIYVVADFLSSALAILLFNIYRCRVMWPDMALSDFLSLYWVMVGQIGFPFVMVGVFYLSGYYGQVFQKSRLQDVLTTFGSCVAGTLLIVFSVLIDDLSDDRSRDYTLFIVLFGILFGCVMIPRLIITSITARKLRRGEIYRNVAIVGYGSDVEAMRRQMSDLRPSMGMKPVAIVTLDNRPAEDVGGLEVYDIEELPELCRRMKIDRVILMEHPSGEWSLTLQVLRDLMRLNLTVLMAHNRQSMPVSAVRHLDVAAEPLVNLTRPYMSESTVVMKRCGDIAVSLVALAVFALPISVLAAIVKITTGDSPFYRQKRLGRGGRPFRICKLRTMRADAESDGQPRLSVPGDPRVTPIGAFMRKYRLDELPQFWNVLKGEMSIVGPRPEREYYVHEIEKSNPMYVLLHQVRPGITSWGMVKYGYASTVEQMIERMRYDLLYVENMSFLLDMKIVFYTFHTVLTGKGL